MLARNQLKGIVIAFAIHLLSACGGEDNAGETAASAPGSQAITVNGVLRYEDWEYGPGGYTGTVLWKPIRYAVIDMVDENGEVADSTVSSAGGEYRLTGSGTGLYLRVLAQTGSAAPLQIAVNNYTGRLYSATASLPTGTTETILNVDLRDSDTVAGAFNILDAMTSAAQLIEEHSTMSMPALEIYWRRGSMQYGTYYCFEGMVLAMCPQGAGIYVSGGFGDSGGDIDHYDDDVLWHEFSHYLEDALNIDDSPGGPHLMTQNTLDLRLSWSEGWGNYFSVAVKAWLSGNAPDLLSTSAQTEMTRYIDTLGNLSGSSANISLDIDNPGMCNTQDCYVYSSNEVAVAKVLNQLRQLYGMQAVWDVYEGDLAGLTGGFVNLESFWDGFLSRTQPDHAQLAVMEAIYGERQIYYREDGFEAGADETPNASRTITSCAMMLCEEEQHIFYRGTGGADVDVVAFDAVAATTYRIETFDLKNGADTHLYLIHANGEPVLDGGGVAIENDDRNGDCGECINDALSFSSEIQFLAPTSATYYIKIVTSAEAEDGAGRYGTYSLKVSEVN